MVSVNSSLAQSRLIPVFFLETSFSVILALVVAFSIKLVGILIINSLLILPAATARLISKRFSDYTGLSVLISLFAGVAGLILPLS